MLIPDLGLLREFDLIFTLVGCDSFWNITELGSKLLTLEFLCTLQTGEDGVTFRFFKEKFTLTWRELSNHLGFHPRAELDLDAALGDFNRYQFWKDLSREDFFYQPRTSDIKHPTLHFLHKWMGFALFLRDDPHKVRIGDLQLLYAALKKVKVSLFTSWCHIGLPHLI